jgi:hypothetical protein
LLFWLFKRHYCKERSPAIQFLTDLLRGIAKNGGPFLARRQRLARQTSDNVSKIVKNRPFYLTAIYLKT